MGPAALTKLAAPQEGNFSVSHDSKYPNEQTRKIIEWCEAVGEIKRRDLLSKGRTRKGSLPLPWRFVDRSET